MNDFRNRLHEAVAVPDVPDAGDLWRRGRAAGRRRVAGIAVGGLAILGGIGLAASQIGDETADIDIVDDGVPNDDGVPTPDAAPAPADDRPVIVVPEGAAITVYPRLSGWDITVSDQSEDIATPSAALRHGGTGELAFIVWSSEPFVDPPPSEVSWGVGRFEADLGLPDDVERTTAWEGPDHTGSISVVGLGTTDPQVAGTAIIESGWLSNIDEAPPAGWTPVFDTRRATGGGVIRATAPNGGPTVRLSTLLFDEPPPAEEVWDFSEVASQTELRILDRLAYRWSTLTVWSDDRSFHVIDYFFDDTEPLDAFIEALVPVESVENSDAPNPAADPFSFPVDERERVSDPSAPPTVHDHWHAAYAIVECGYVLHAIEDDRDTVGIHTHGDGLIHIHPSGPGSAGENATFSHFLDVLGSFYNEPRSAEEMITTWDEVDCDGQPSETRLLRWRADRYEEPPDVFIGLEWLDARFDQDREAWMIARVPVSTDNADIEFPIGRIEELALVAGAGETEDD
ncbi:MAG: hypothetical protein AAF548_08385 [Actinomycetota bacterium]